VRYRVWWVPQVPMKAFYVEVDDLKTAVKIVDVLADYDIFQYENRVKPDYSNVGGVQVWSEDENDWLDLDEDEITEALT
jgi:hypothetical protein